jgi:hypothetical protein
VLDPKGRGDFVNGQERGHGLGLVEKGQKCMGKADDSSVSTIFYYNL